MLKYARQLCAISPDNEADALAYKDQYEKTLKLQNGVHYYDSLRTVAAVNYTKASKTGFFGYEVNVRLKCSDEKTGVQTAKDNASVILTPDFKVKEKSDFIDILD